MIPAQEAGSNLWSELIQNSYEGLNTESSNSHKHFTITFPSSFSVFFTCDKVYFLVDTIK